MPLGAREKKAVIFLQGSLRRKNVERAAARILLAMKREEIKKCGYLLSMGKGGGIFNLFIWHHRKGFR